MIPSELEKMLDDDRAYLIVIHYPHVNAYLHSRFIDEIRRNGDVDVEVFYVNGYMRMSNGTRIQFVAGTMEGDKFAGWIVDALFVVGDGWVDSKCREMLLTRLWRGGRFTAPIFIEED